jgi:L-2-hydroxyglutarate oxidase LhgO
MSEVFETDAVVIGAGLVGLACARRLAMGGIDTVILEAEASIGQGISSRNSEVIHAGIYYRSDSLKARLCVNGRQQLYQYCLDRHIPHQKIGKWVVATSKSELEYLEELSLRAVANGVTDTYLIDRDEAQAIEPELICEAALVSPSTGIVDTHALMQSFLGDFESAGGDLALNSIVKSVNGEGQRILLNVSGQEDFRLSTRYLVNAAGLNAPALTRALSPLGQQFERKFAKGNYFSYQGKAPFSRLIYPVPEPGGLGVHLTFDLAGQARFGPDVEWVDHPEYKVSIHKAAGFAAAIWRYWPSCNVDRLAPAYAGVRPKIFREGRLVDDFLILSRSSHGVSGLVDLYGIESPGLTASMAIADEVMLQLNLH